MADHISFQDVPAVVSNSDYKWLSSTLKSAQNGPGYTPYLKLQIKDNSLKPNAILSSPNVPVLGDATTAPDGSVLMAGGDGSGNLKFWKLSDASASIPSGTTLVSSGSGYVSTLNTSIAVSNWINGSYYIDIYFWRNPGGAGNLPALARSADGGNTWTVNPFTYPSITAFPTAQNFYIAATQPIYNPTLNIVESTAFYIRAVALTGSIPKALQTICYINWNGGTTFGNETPWSRAVNSQDWVLHSLDVQYLNGSWFVFFSGYQNWYETASGNSNYGIYVARLDDMTSNSTTDSWQLVNQILVANSSQNVNLSSFTFPRITTDGSLFYLIFNAVVVEGQQNSASGATQISSVPSKYYYFLKSSDLKNFSYPLPLFFTNGTVYADTAGVSFVNQGAFFYLLGNGQRWQYIQNSTVADVTNSVINYQIQEVAGSSSSITITIGNANNKWIGSSPTGVGANAIAINSEILLEQGYVTSVGNELAPRNIFYIDTITLNSSSADNTATITGRDINRNLQNVSTKFSYSTLGTFYYNDLFDGSTLQNWNQISGTWIETGGVLTETSGNGIISQSQINNNQESAIIFTAFISPQNNTASVAVYPLYQDSNNYFKLSIGVNGGNTNLVLNTTLVIGGVTLISTVATMGSLPGTPGVMPIFIRKYNYHTYDVLIGTPNSSYVLLNHYTDDILSGTGPYAPFYSIVSIQLDSVYTPAFLLGGGVPLVSGPIALGSSLGVDAPDFQPFKYIQFGESLSLQDSMQYLGAIAGILNYKPDTIFFDNLYLHANYNGSYSVQNGFMDINPSNLIINTNDTISNGEINFNAIATPVDATQNFGIAFMFRSSSTTTPLPGSANAYFFFVEQTPTGTVAAFLYLFLSGAFIQLASSFMTGSSSSIPIDIRELHTYKIVMIDQIFYIFIDGRAYLIWQDTNAVINSLQFSSGFWGIEAPVNSTISAANFTSFQLYNQLSNVTFNPGDDMVGILQNVLETAFAYSYTDQFGRYIGIVLNSTDPSNYTYQNGLYTVQAQGSTSSIINEVVVTGNNVIATYKDTALIAVTGQVRSVSITDYTIMTYQDALTRAINELVSTNSLSSQNSPTNPMNVGSELFDVITIINNGSNSTSLNGNFRIFNQTFSLNGSKGQYSSSIETGNL